MEEIMKNLQFTLDTLNRVLDDLLAYLAQAEGSENDGD